MSMLTLPSDPRVAKLDPRHHHFVYAPDPWHLQAFAGVPSVVEAFREGRIYQPQCGNGLHAGPWHKVWYSADVDGRLIGEWGHDMPVGVPVCVRCGSPNMNGAEVFCANCGAAYPT